MKKILVFVVLVGLVVMMGACGGEDVEPVDTVQVQENVVGPLEPEQTPELEPESETEYISHVFDGISFMINTDWGIDDSGDAFSININDGGAVIILQTNARLSNEADGLLDTLDSLLFMGIVEGAFNGQEATGPDTVADAHERYQVIGTNYIMPIGEELISAMSFMLADESRTLMLHMVVRDANLAPVLFQFTQSIEFLSN